jgi:hypothetical protein
LYLAGVEVGDARPEMEESRIKVHRGDANQILPHWRRLPGWIIRYDTINQRLQRLMLELNGATLSLLAPSVNHRQKQVAQGREVMRSAAAEST